MSGTTTDEMLSQSLAANQLNTTESITNEVAATTATTVEDITTTVKDITTTVKDITTTMQDITTTVKVKTTELRTTAVTTPQATRVEETRVTTAANVVSGSTDWVTIGVIIGVVGAVVLVIIVVLAVLVRSRKRRMRKATGATLIKLQPFEGDLEENRRISQTGAMHEIGSEGRNSSTLIGSNIELTRFGEGEIIGELKEPPTEQTDAVDSEPQVILPPDIKIDEQANFTSAAEHNVRGETIPSKVEETELIDPPEKNPLDSAVETSVTDLDGQESSENGMPSNQTITLADKMSADSLNGVEGKDETVNTEGDTEQPLGKDEQRISEIVAPGEEVTPTEDEKEESTVGGRDGPVNRLEETEAASETKKLAEEPLRPKSESQTPELAAVELAAAEPAEPETSEPAAAGPAAVKQAAAAPATDEPATFEPAASEPAAAGPAAVEQAAAESPTAEASNKEADESSPDDHLERSPRL